jgi:hypothetical protein
VSPPTADDYRAEVERAWRALMGMNPDRAACLDIARALRELHAESVRILGQTEADALVLPTLKNAKWRILAVFGMGGWDEREA